MSSLVLTLIWDFFLWSILRLLDYNCHIPNFKTCLRYVWLQYDIKYLQLFVSKTPSVVWYFIINLIPPKVYGYFALFKLKSSHIYLYLSPNYLFWTLQIYLDFMQSFPLSKSKLLCSVLLMKHLLGDLF